MASETPSAIGAVRQRRRAERDQPDRRAQILQAADRVLAQTPLHELNVAAIQAEAGIARGTFYAYFESKFEVVAALMDTVMEDMYGLLAPFVEREDGVDPATAIRAVLTESATLWHQYQHVFRATHDNRHAVPELKGQWLRVTERFTDAVADEISREIAAGRAPEGRDARQLAAALVWSSEHLLYVAGAGDDADLPSEAAIIDTMVALWLGTIYGGMR